MDNRRYLGLDALRGFMMMLGVVLHSSMLYLAPQAPTMPIPTDHNNTYALNLIYFFIHDFRMPAFFVLAGFFTSLLVDKRGVSGTYKNRVSRILLPLLAALVLILPAAGILWADFLLSVRFGTHDLIPNQASLQILEREMADKAGIPAGQVPIGHLWFLYYLCMFYLLIPACRWAIARSHPVQARLRSSLGSPLALGVFALWTALTLWPFKGGQVLEGFIFFRPHPPSLLYYGSFFVFGYFFHTYREFLDATVRHLRFTVLVSVVLFPLSLWISVVDNSMRGTDAQWHFYAVLSNALCTWALIYAFIGAALRFFDRKSRWIDYAAQSSYWVFLIHMPLVMLAGWWLVPFDLPAVLKFLLVSGFASVIALLTFHYAVQKTWIGRFLHGQRLDLEWPWVVVAR